MTKSKLATPNLGEPDLLKAARSIEAFTGSQLTRRIAALEGHFVGTSDALVKERLEQASVSHDLLAAAYVLKQVAGQINVVIHTVGILLCLPKILEAGERIESLSLGAGNTGRAFDLVTDKRIAEFKFIHWQGGTETIRQNALFKDLYQMAEYVTDKRKVMYVLGKTHPLKFLTGGRALSSVMSRNRKLWESFQAKHGTHFKTVRQYYEAHGAAVELVDLSMLLPELTRLVTADQTSASEMGDSPALESSP